MTWLALSGTRASSQTQVSVLEEPSSVALELRVTRDLLTHSDLRLPIPLPNSVMAYKSKLDMSKEQTGSVKSWICTS